MSKHTPGPWYIDPIKAHANGNRRIMAEQCTPVAVVPIHLAADARLIAAAPEMCALLGNLAAACDGWDEDWENDEQRADAFWHLARAAKVLLAEIEGGGNNG